MTPVVLSVPSSVSTGTGVRQFCTGWTGTGDAPATGVGNLVTLLPVQQNSEVDWTWQQQDQVMVNVTGEGQVFGNAGWVATGGSQTLTAIPNPGFRFERWQGDVIGTNPAQVITVTNPDNTTRAITGTITE